MLSSHLLQAQISLLSLSVLIASRKQEEGELMPPESVSFAAQFGLGLHQKFGGGENLPLAHAIADATSLTPEDIDVMLDFFANYSPDESDPGWQNNDKPSADWIRWLLMGSYPGWKWAQEIKKWMDGKGSKPECLWIPKQLCTPNWE